MGGKEMGTKYPKDKIYLCHRHSVEYILFESDFVEVDADRIREIYRNKENRKTLGLEELK